MAKVNLENLKQACRAMVDLIEQMQNPATAASGQMMGFAFLADRIRFELDGEEKKA